MGKMSETYGQKRLRESPLNKIMTDYWANVANRTNEQEGESDELRYNCEGSPKAESRSETD